MLEHVTIKRKGVFELPKFDAPPDWPPTSLCGPLPLLWTSASINKCDGARWSSVPKIFGLEIEGIMFRLVVWI